MAPHLRLAHDFRAEVHRLGWVVVDEHIATTGTVYFEIEPMSVMVEVGVISDDADRLSIRFGDHDQVYRGAHLSVSPGEATLRDAVDLIAARSGTTASALAARVLDARMERRRVEFDRRLAVERRMAAERGLDDAAFRVDRLREATGNLTYFRRQRDAESVTEATIWLAFLRRALR